MHKFKIGNKVNHNIYGIGKIIEFNNNTVYVDFEIGLKLTFWHEVDFNLYDLNLIDEETIQEWFNKLETKLLLQENWSGEYYCLTVKSSNMMYIPKSWPIDRIKSAILHGVEIYEPNYLNLIDEETIQKWFTKLETKLLLQENWSGEYYCLVSGSHAMMYIPKSWPNERIKTALLHGVEVYEPN